MDARPGARARQSVDADRRGRTVASMESHQPISADSLQAGLLQYDLCTETQLQQLLGAARHEISLNQLELALINSGTVPNDRLLLLKGTLSGLRIHSDPSVATVSRIPAEASRAIGAFVLDRPSLTLALVEDSEYNIEMAASFLGTADFEVWLITAGQFDALYRSTYTGESTGEDPETRDIFEVLDEGVRRRASDIHLQVGEPPGLRVDGTVIRLPRQPLTQAWIDREVPQLVGPDRYDTVTTTFDVDAAYSYGASRFRVNVGADFRGQTVALRKIPTKVPTLDEIGLPPAARGLCDLERGLVLVTGPTGSGKSTTLAAMLSHIGATYSRHIITLEDPIEFHIPAGKSMINQRELFESFSSFPNGLRQALRQDPDVILVGELRDLETMKTALTAAETGHLVFGTLHTYDASATVARLVSSFPPEEQAHARAQLAYILKGIISQSLLQLASAKGRAAAFEIMLGTPAIQNNLSKLDGHKQLRQTMETSMRDGMRTMEMSLVELCRSGLVREEDARHYAPDRESFDRRMDLAQ